MRERFIPALITLIAGTAISIINIVNEVGLYNGLQRLLLVLVIFYMLGLIVKAIIVRVIKLKPQEEVENESVIEGEEEKQAN